MEFTPDSIKIMSFMMKSFRSFYKRKTPEQQDHMDRILTAIYYNINRSAIDFFCLKDIEDGNNCLVEIFLLFSNLLNILSPS